MPPVIVLRADHQVQGRHAIVGFDHPAAIPQPLRHIVSNMVLIDGFLCDLRQC